MRISTQRGFTLIETMVATVVLCIGLLGVALMQTTAITGNSFAWNMNRGSNIAQQWMEWNIVQVSRPNQDTTPFLGHLQKENYVALAALDDNTGDDGATAVQMPATREAMARFLSQKGFRNASGAAFSTVEFPELPGAGYTMTWRVMAERPLPNTATVVIETRAQNAFARNLTKPIRFIVSTEM